MADFYALAASLTPQEADECALELLARLERGGIAPAGRLRDEAGAQQAGALLAALAEAAALAEKGSASGLGERAKSAREADAANAGYMTLRRSVDGLESPPAGRGGTLSALPESVAAAREAAGMETAAAYPTAEELSRLIARDSRRMDAAFERF